MHRHLPQSLVKVDWQPFPFKQLKLPGWDYEKAFVIVKRKEAMLIGGRQKTNSSLKSMLT